MGGRGGRTCKGTHAHTPSCTHIAQTTVKRNVQIHTHLYKPHAHTHARAHTRTHTLFQTPTNPPHKANYPPLALVNLTMVSLSQPMRARVVTT